MRNNLLAIFHRSVLTIFQLAYDRLNVYFDTHDAAFHAVNVLRAGYLHSPIALESVRHLLQDPVRSLGRNHASAA